MELCQHSLLQVIFLANARLDRRSLGNAIHPLQQMRELAHLLLGEASPLPTFDPGPSPDISDGVLALSLSSEVLTRLAGVFA